MGEPVRWRENVGSWEELVYRELYPGIDLHLSGKATGLKYEFRLAPGADWRQVKVRYDGIERLELGDDGALVIQLGNSLPPLRDGAPVIYQEMDGRRIDVAGRFRLVEGLTYGFDVTSHYDPARPLVIDPVIDWGSYVGDHLIGGNVAYAVAVDRLGNVVLTGESPYFVAKISPTGAHVWSAYLGVGSTTGNDIAVDEQGYVLVVGSTTGSGWMSGGYDTSFGGMWDGFVVKLSPGGQHLWSAYLGGTNVDFGYGIDTDDAGNALALDNQSRVHVAGTTTSTNWIAHGWDTSFNGGQYDAFAIAVTQWPVPLIRIRSIESLPVGGFRIEFSVTADPAPAFLVEGASALAEPTLWMQESGVTISPLAAGLFEARVPQRGGRLFYRIRTAAP